MNKTLTTLIIGSFTLSSILTSTPAFAKNDNNKGNNGNRGKSPVTFVKSSDDEDESRTKILDNGNITKVQTVGPNKSKNALNLKFKWHEGSDDLKITVPKGTMTSSSQAFVDAVKAAFATYKASIATAKQNFLDAIAAARAAYLNNTTTTNQAPTVASAASASPATVTGTTTTLSVLGADDGGENNLIYTWSFTKPTNAVDPTFSINGTNASKNTVVTLVSPGTYTFTVTIKDAGNLTVQSAVNVTVSNNGPVITATAGANPSPVTSGTTTTLSVQAVDDGGAGNLTYFWSTTAKPGSVYPTFSVNSSTSANNTVVTFPSAGAYTFKVVVTDANGLSAESSVNVYVYQLLSAVTISPTSTAVSMGSSTQFNASAFDQFNLPQSSNFFWSIFESPLGGSIGSSGLYTAPTNTTGTFHVIVKSQSDTSKQATSTVTVH